MITDSMGFFLTPSLMIEMVMMMKNMVMIVIEMVRMIRVVTY